VSALRAIVVDDEPLAREGMAELLASMDGIDVTGVFADGRSAIAAIDAERPDVLFIDIQMPGLDGFDVVAALDRERLPAIVFVTAHDAFAIRAFEVDALDYLLKPVTRERLATALDRVRKVAGSDPGSYRGQVESLLQRMAPVRPAGVGRLIVREVGEVIVIPVRDVDWIEGADYYARLHVGTKAHLIRETLSSLEQRLDPARFMRIHRSMIVNLARVNRVQAEQRGDGIVTLMSGAKLKVMRSRRQALEQRLEALHDTA
jgi:two-component system LytT family response regulator